MGDTIIADICHIEAVESNGPRYNPTQSNEQRHSFDNLILLCPNHHRLIDTDPEKYTVEVLKKIKNDHQQKYVNNPYLPSQKILEAAEEILTTATKISDNVYGDLRCKKCGTYVGLLIGTGVCPNCKNPISS